MQYMLLVHYGTAPRPQQPDLWASLTSAEQSAIADGYRAVNELPAVSPGLVLQSPIAVAATVRVVNGTTQLSHGTYGPIGDAMDAFFLMDADNLDDAIEVAIRIPAAQMGGAVEVRAVQPPVTTARRS